MIFLLLALRYSDLGVSDVASLLYFKWQVTLERILPFWEIGHRFVGIPKVNRGIHFETQEDVVSRCISLRIRQGIDSYLYQLSALVKKNGDICNTNIANLVSRRTSVLDDHESNTSYAEALITLDVLLTSFIW